MVYGIGNPLIDILINIDDVDLSSLNLSKGTMHLIDEERRKEILSYIKNKEITYSCGGSCPNTIISLSAFGIKTTLAGKIANDEFGSIYTSQLQNLGVISDIKSGNENPTGSSIIMISPDTERTMNTYLGMCRFFSAADISEKLLLDSEILYFTGYMWDTESQKEAVMKAINLAKKQNIKIVFDVADPFAVQRNKDDFLRLIEKNIDIVLANNEEAKILFDNENIQKGINELSKITNIAIVKNGPKGSFIKQKNEDLLEIPVNKVEAIDTTGAGDMYAAGFIYGLSKKYNLYNSGICASFLASQIILQKGAQFSEEKITTLKEVLSNGKWKYC